MSNNTRPITLGQSTLAVERVYIDRELIRLAISVCESAIENASVCAAEHEVCYGHKTKKNKLIGEMYAEEMALATRCRDQCREAMGWPVIGEDK